jgi:hypothetical protein
MSELTPTQREQMIAERQEARSKVREAFRRAYNNPFRTKDVIFDPAVFRYEAARAYAREYFKITPRSMAIPIGLLACTVLLQLYLNKNYAQRENEIRSGNKTYYERALWSSRFNC